MSLNNDQLKEYEMLKNEQLKIQEIKNKLYTWGIAGMVILLGFAVNNQENPLSFIIALIPAIFMPFLYLWSHNLDYTGHRISKYIRKKIEPTMWMEVEENEGWENWARNYRKDEVKGESPRFIFTMPWSKRMKTPKHGRLSPTLFNILFLLFIPLSVGVSIFLAFKIEDKFKPVINCDIKQLIIAIVAALSFALYWHFWRSARFDKKRLEC